MQNNEEEIKVGDTVYLKDDLTHVKVVEEIIGQNIICTWEEKGVKKRTMYMRSLLTKKKAGK